MRRAVVLLSGGLDSSTVLAMALERGYSVTALTFEYGQRHDRELDCARMIAERMGVAEHAVVDLDFGTLLNSSLTDASRSIPDRAVANVPGDIPSTYVPARNVIFLSVGAAIAESMGAEAVFIAANALDYSGYPDCTPEFMEAFQRALDVGTKRGIEGEAVRIEAPLIDMSKADIVREALRLSVPLELTWSCYRGGEKACGACDSCRLRLKGFQEAGAEDPLDYERGEQG